MNRLVLSALSFSAIVGLSSVSHAQVLAFDTPSGTIGHQAFAGALGLDFNVITPITINSLGFFDSGSNGIQNASTAITVQIFDRTNTVVPIATQLFTFGSDGALAPGSGFRFKSITGLNLAAGFQGRITASGFNVTDPNGNTDVSFGDPAAIRNSGGGQIGFPLVSGNYVGYYGGAPLGYPTIQDNDSYLAGSFTFSATASATAPEPGTIALVCLGASGLLIARRRRA